MISKSLHFGVSNYFFCKSDETDGTYNYYAFMDKKNSVLIMRTNKAASEAKYFASTGDLDVLFTARASKTYTYPNILIDPTY